MKPQTNTTLPPPPAAALRQSEQLQQRIRQAVTAAKGFLPFDRYMEMALYTPHLGYYSSPTHKFGKGGDFITAPELSPLFALTLAGQVAEILNSMDGGDLLEFGAGSGALAADLLQALESRQQLPDHYLIIELSGDLQQRQQQRLQQQVPHLLPRVEWLSSLPERPFQGVILANELLDAMPAERFQVSASGVEECGVTVNREGELLLTHRPLADNTPLARYLTPLCQALQLSPGYASECNLRALHWIATLPSFCQRAMVLLIDYGFPRHEFYHPQRRQGTLMCHYQMFAHSDPLRWPGLQDITTHVDFTAIADAALAAGMQVRGFTSQGAFLLAAGLMHLMQPDRTEQQRLNDHNAIKRLTLPSEMGELFKVMALAYHHPFTPSGFSQQDDRHRL
ncbi:MAG: SAM-dependent methyltransferase [Gammaproteobacteria bacterium]|nr:SAM-dependent methyltransferase [Gammaproteobacteria bacterium]